MFKKLLAALATVGLALGMIAVTAGPASAHHNTINPVITCTDDYQYKVDWSVTNSETLTETITASSDTALVPVGTTFGNKETKVFTEYFSAPVNKTLTLSAKWSNNNTATNDAKIKQNQFPDCEPNHVPVTLCHATPPDTAAQGWEAITVDDDSIVTSGHNEQHDLDIIPAFDYWAQVDDVWTLLHFAGKNLDTVFSGIPGSAILAAGCEYTVTPNAPTFAPAVCTGPGTWGLGSYTIPSTTGVIYQVRINETGDWTTTGAGTYYEPKGTIIEVRAVGSPEWVGVNEPSTWEYTVPDPGDCIIEATPVTPTATAITECDAYGSLEIPTTTGVLYTLVEGDGLQGYWKVVATPLTGYSLPGGVSEVVFDGDLGEYTECVEPDPAQFEASVCTGPGTESGGSYTIPSTPGVTYEVKIGDEDWVTAVADTYPVTVFPTTVSVRAIAQDGYTLTDYDGPWTYTFETAGECLELATPVDPTVTPITECGVYGSVTLPETTGVVYELTVGDGKQGAWEVTATPAKGYYFDGGQTEIVFDGDLGEYTECAPTQAVIFVDGECVPFVEDEPQPAIVGTPVQGTFTIPSVTGIQFTVSINGGPFTDYPAAEYTANEGDSIVVKAYALPGYTLQGTDQWSHTFAEIGPCDAPTLGEVFPAASATSQTCTAQGTLFLKPTEHVIYSIDGTVSAQGSIPVAPGTYTVTAVTDSPEFGIFGPDEWLLTVDGSGPCPQVLASTGTMLPIAAGSIAGGLLFLGVAFLLVRRRRAA